MRFFDACRLAYIYIYNKCIVNTHTQTEIIISGEFDVGSHWHKLESEMRYIVSNLFPINTCVILQAYSSLHTAAAVNERGKTCVVCACDAMSAPMIAASSMT